MSQLRYLKNVVTLSLDAEKCVGCGLCTVVCPHGVFEIQNRKAVIVDRDACMECGACSRNCPVEAISVEPGVGCATAVLSSKLSGSGQVSCGDSNCKCCNQPSS